MAINHTLKHINSSYEAEWAAHAQSFDATTQNNKSPEEESVGWQPKNELELNALSFMGASPTAIHVNKLIGQQKLQPAEFNKPLGKAGNICDLSGFPDGFRDSCRFVHAHVPVVQTGEERENTGFHLHRLHQDGRNTYLVHRRGSWWSLYRHHQGIQIGRG